MSPTEIENATKILKSLASESRLQIVSLLLAGEQNVSVIHKTVGGSQPSISQHLSKLRRSGVVSARREQRHIYYYLSNAHIVRVLGIMLEMQDQKKAA